MPKIQRTKSGRQRNEYDTLKLPKTLVMMIDKLSEDLGFTSRTDCIKTAVRTMYMNNYGSLVLSDLMSNKAMMDKKQTKLSNLKSHN